MTNFEVPTDLSAFSVEDIHGLIESARAEFNTLNETDDLSDETLDSMTELADAIDALHSEITSKTQEQVSTKRNGLFFKVFGMSMNEKLAQRKAKLEKYYVAKDEEKEEEEKAEEEEEEEDEEFSGGHGSPSEILIHYPASDYAYSSSSGTSATYKLRLTSTPGGDPDVRFVNAAATALRVIEIPADDLSRVKAKVRAAWVKANPGESEDNLPPILNN